MQFDNIFPGKGVWRLEETDEGFIERFTTARIDEPLQSQEVGGRFVRFNAEQSCQDAERLAAADSENGNATAAGRRGQSNNSIGRHGQDPNGFVAAEEGRSLSRQKPVLG